MILAQAVPIGIDVRSPLTWFGLAIGAIVLALTLSTRRGQSRPRPAPLGFPARSPQPADAAAALDWASVQARFDENPATGLAAAQALVERAMSERRTAGVLRPALERRVALACERAAQPDANTESRRLALLDLREIFSALRDESGAEPS